jgi:hypothetical protein
VPSSSSRTTAKHNWLQSKLQRQHDKQGMPEKGDGREMCTHKIRTSISITKTMFFSLKMRKFDAIYSANHGSYEFAAWQSYAYSPSLFTHQTRSRQLLGQPTSA